MLLRLLTFCLHWHIQSTEKNDAMTKVKTILLKQGGLSNDGLDICSMLGVTETGRSFRNLRDFLSGISEHLMIASSKSMPHQSTLTI